jgi:DNA-binding MarR family transcriptional regulator
MELDLKLEHQLCFPLYASSKELIKRYKPLLDELDLTYTQYIAMMILWEKKSVNVNELGRFLFLDSGTLTPMLKKMEQKGLLCRTRQGADERKVLITITDAGETLKERAKRVPQRIAACVNLTPDEADTLYRLLYKLLSNADNTPISDISDYENYTRNSDVSIESSSTMSTRKSDISTVTTETIHTRNSDTEAGEPA